MAVSAMDVFGIVYIIENAQQFWSGAELRADLCHILFVLIYFMYRAELEDILHLPEDVSLEQLDATLARFIHFCANYHGAISYTRSPVHV